MNLRLIYALLLVSGILIGCGGSSEESQKQADLAREGANAVYLSFSDYLPDDVSINTIDLEKSISGVTAIGGDGTIYVSHVFRTKQLPQIYSTNAVAQTTVMKYASAYQTNGLTKWHRKGKNGVIVGPNNIVYALSDGIALLNNNGETIKNFFVEKNLDIDDVTFDYQGDIHLVFQNKWFELDSELSIKNSLELPFDRSSRPYITREGTLVTSSSEFDSETSRLVSFVNHIDTKGQIVWSTSIEQDAHFMAVDPSGNFVVTGQSSVYSIDSQGKLNWTKKYGDRNADSGIYINSLPVIDKEGGIYISLLNTNEDSRIKDKNSSEYLNLLRHYDVTKLDKQGGEIWRYRVQAPTKNLLGDGFTTLLLTENNELIVSNGASLFSLDQVSGNVLWQRDIPHRGAILKASHDGNLVLMDSSLNKMHRLKLPNPPARGGWPMTFGNAQSSGNTQPSLNGNPTSLDIVGEWSFSITSENCPDKAEYGYVTWTYVNGAYGLIVSSSNGLILHNCQYIGEYTDSNNGELYAAPLPISATDFKAGLSVFEQSIRIDSVSFISTNRIEITGVDRVSQKPYTLIFTR